MSSFDLFSMAIRNLLKRKLRTFLTVLGVIIGTSSIVVMVSFGIGLNESFIASMEMMGDITTIEVYKPYNYGSSYSMGGSMMLSSSSSSSSSSSKDEILLDDAAIEKFKQIPNVVTATPFLDMYMSLESGKYQSSWVQVRGIDTEAMNLLGYNIINGRLLDSSDKFQAVYGYEVPHDFYNPNDRHMEWSWYDGIGEDTRTPNVDVYSDKVTMKFNDINDTDQDGNAIRIKDYTLEAVGTLEKKYMNDRYIFMNIEQVQKIKTDKERIEAQLNAGNSNNNWGGTAGQKKTEEGYNNAIVKCVDMESVTEVKQAITDMGFESHAIADQLKELQNMSAIIQAVLGGIGGVSLFVAAIGIANTMIMSIYERTKEIGVMKVIGATLSDIGKLFLVEASLIGLIGGIIGLGFSYGISYLINTFGSQFASGMGMGSTLSIIPIWLSLLALGFSAAIGLISGYLPARRAMKLSALNALRTE